MEEREGAPGAKVGWSLDERDAEETNTQNPGERRAFIQQDDVFPRLGDLGQPVRSLHVRSASWDPRPPSWRRHPRRSGEDAQKGGQTHPSLYPDRGDHPVVHAVEGVWRRAERNWEIVNEIQGNGRLSPVLRAGEPAEAWMGVVDFGAGPLRFGWGDASAVAERPSGPFGSCGLDLAASIVEPHAWLHLGRNW